VIGGDVERVPGDARPPWSTDGTIVLSFLRRLLIPVLAVAVAASIDALGRGFAKLVYEVRSTMTRDIVFDGRRIVVGVDVGIDDG
jgi:hypothetical protein